MPDRFRGTGLNTGEVLILLTCGWLSGTISGVAGFGGALILLPVVTLTVGGKAAVPILTVAQLMGNSRGPGSAGGTSGGGRRCGSASGPSRGACSGRGCSSRSLPRGIPRWIGVVLLVVIAFRHTGPGKREMAEWLLTPCGFGVGLLSAIAGSAGPLGAAVFLSRHPSDPAYVSSEAVTAVLMHATKSLVYRA